MKHIKQTLLSAYALCLALLSSGSVASPVVVELFTSQGCSSCPPADALVEELATDQDLLVLSLPVTYWDYLGWKDTLAREAHTKRQHAYARKRGTGQVYTPQIIIDGDDHVVGSRRSDVLHLIKTRQAQKRDEHLNIEFDGANNQVTISATAATAAKDADIILVAFDFSRSVKIGRGENHGRTITYTNVVKDMTVIGSYKGSAVTLPLKIPAPEQGYALLIQDHKSGHIIGAAHLSK